MKKVFEHIVSFILLCFLIIFSLIIAPFAFIYYIIDTPIKFFKYRKSEYYKDFKLNFSRSLVNSYDYQIYSYVKSNPNIEFVKTTGDFYLQNETTIAFFFVHSDIYYNDGQLKYTIEDENDQKTEFNLLDLYNTYSEVYQKQGKMFKFIVDKDLFRDEEQYELAKQEDIFILIEKIEDYKTITL